MKALDAGPPWFAQTSDAGTGCYVHIPFCDRICPYCDFAVVRYKEEHVARYMSALLTEIQLTASVGGDWKIAPCPGGPIQTLYFGGGTPSTLPRSWFEKLSLTIFDCFETTPGSIEFTLEANPSRATAALDDWLALGVNRLSIGVQSFDEHELRRLGREHDATQAISFYRAARVAGFANISLDLMVGVPGQSEATFVRSLEAALRLEPEHISAYGLTIEDTTPYARWHRREPAVFPDDDAVANLLDRAHTVLTRAGMTHYEISNFARPSFESAHNLGYWRQRNCLAFGLSASGYRDGLRYRNTRSMAHYCDRLERGVSPIEEEERLSETSRVGEAAMLALRSSAGIEHEDFLRRFGVDAKAAFASAREKCKALRLLEEDERGMRLTQSGRLLCNTVCAEFLEPELAVVR